MKEIIKLVSNSPLSEEDKVRLKKHTETKDKHLEKIKEDYENGVYDEFIKTLPFNRCFDCEWIACENHEKCLKDKIK